MVGGQLLMPGVAALCRNWPDWDDWQVLQIVIISPFVLMLPYVWWVQTSQGFQNGGAYCQNHYIALITLTTNALFLLWFVVFHPSVFVLFCVLSPHPSPPRLCRIFPESLRWLLATQHYRRAKAMMLRIVRRNQDDMTTEPSRVFTGGEDMRTNGPKSIQL